MRKRYDSAAKIAAMFGKFSFRFVSDIYLYSSPSERVDESKIIRGRGFVVCIIGHDVLIQVSDPNRKDAALRYAQNVVRTRVKHHFDDERYLRKLEDEDGDAYAEYVLGRGYVQAQYAENATSYQTGLSGVSIETPFRLLRNVECPEDIDD